MNIPEEWPKELNVSEGGLESFVKGYNQACQDCLSIHLKKMAEKDKEITRLRTALEKIATLSGGKVGACMTEEVMKIAQSALEGRE